MTEHQYRGLLADLMTAVREPQRGVRSIRRLAEHCGVSDRTARRWLDGTDWPDSSKVRRMQSWLRSVSQASHQ